MTQQRISLVLALGVSLFAACDKPPSRAETWDNYHSTIDNDSYYQAPDCSIMDAPSCGGD